MSLRILRTTCFAALTVVAIPYAVAMMTNILCGWPLCAKRYRRAFNPHKVFALNWALLLQLGKLRYVRLMIRCRNFYQNASRNRLLKNIPYGSNGNCLDIYFPVDETARKDAVLKSHRPVVVFIYGGSWGSGDKSMYGLLASQLADNLSAIVICPNYSTYPKGFVDDMAQDVSDVLAFVHQHCDIYCMDRGRIALIGHSAGAHLAALTVLELSLKHLSDEPASQVSQIPERRVDSLQVSVIDSPAFGTSADTLRMHETHFNGDSSAGDLEPTPAVGSVPTVASSSFYVVDTEDTSSAVSAAGSIVTQPTSDETPNVTEAKANGNESFYFVDEDKTISATADNSEETSVSVPAEVPEDTEPEEEQHQQDEEMEDKTETAVKAEFIEALPPVVPLTHSTPGEPSSLLTSVRLVIGIAGVYDIAAHYQHEAMRGLEDISTMARAMYGPKRFDRFSPTLIVENLPRNAWLPPIHLIHGSNDHVVPVSSSTRFGDAVWRRGASVVTATVVSGCSHYDICMDLMENGRFWHKTVMSEIRRAFVQHVQAS